MFFPGFDPLYLLFVAPGMLLALWATFKVKSTFARYAEVPVGAGISGAEVARALIAKSRRPNVSVEEAEGFLSDHYDPRAGVVRLSPDVYRGRSVSAVGVAAHECGHVLQDAEGYAPMRFRQNLVWAANLGSTFSWILMIGGMFLQLSGMVWLGILAFAGVVLFQLVTLPVEFNASSRARAALTQTGLISVQEGQAVGKVLNAAALTYVAALVTSVLQLLYFLVRFGGIGNRDD